MANSANFPLAVSNTPKQDGWCELYAELLLLSRSGLYPTAFNAYEAVPQKRGGTPPNDGNYYLIYFDGWYNLGEGLQRYGDIAVYRNGRVWSGSSVNFRRQDQSVTFAYYKSWIGTQYLCWSEFLGSIRVATREVKQEGYKMQKTALKRLVKAMLNRDVNAEDERKYLNQDPNWVIMTIDNWAIENQRTYSQTVAKLKQELDSDTNAKKIQEIKKIVG